MASSEPIAPRGGTAMNGQALRVFCGAERTAPDTVPDLVQARIRTLVHMAAHLEEHMKRRAAIGGLIGREQHEVAALKWALRIVTLPELQGEAYAQVFEAGQTAVKADGDL